MPTGAANKGEVILRTSQAGYEGETVRNIKFRKKKQTANLKKQIDSLLKQIYARILSPSDTFMTSV